jgi:hypothetical protein
VPKKRNPTVHPSIYQIEDPIESVYENHFSFQGQTLENFHLAVMQSNCFKVLSGDRQIIRKLEWHDVFGDSLPKVDTEKRIILLKEGIRVQIKGEIKF